MADSNYVLVVVNKSKSIVKVYFYNSYDHVNWISRKSIIVEEDDEQMYEKKRSFKYQVEVGETLHAVIFLESKVLLQIDPDCKVSTERLCDEILMSRRVSIVGYTKFAKENSSKKSLNYFKVLGMERTITKTEEEEKSFLQTLKENYHAKIRLYHPDLNPDPTGENEKITKEIILAYDILSDKYRRANYINTMDSLTWSRFLKNIYWPEATSSEEEEARTKKLLKRLLFTFISVGLLAGGIVTCVFGAPVVGAVAGMGLIGGALQGGSRAVLNKKCDTKDFLYSTALGAIVGASTGAVTGVLSSVAAATVGNAVLSTGQQAAIGIAAGVTNGSLSSIAKNIERIVLDKEEISSKKMLKDAAAGAILGGAIGGAGGAIAGAINASATQYLDEAAEVAAVAASRKIGFKVLEKGAKFVTEKSLNVVSYTNVKFIENRLDEDSENQEFQECISLL